MKTFQKMIFILVSKGGEDILPYFCPVGWENQEVEKWYICLYIKDFIESASSKFLFDVLDGWNGALPKIRHSGFMIGVEQQSWQLSGIESGW